MISKHLIAILSFLLAIIIFADLCMAFPAFTDSQSILGLYSRRSDELSYLAEQCSGNFVTWNNLPFLQKLRFFRSGLEYIDARAPDRIAQFSFNTLNSEGGLILCYSPSGESPMLVRINEALDENISEIPAEGLTIENIRTEKGYFYCIPINESWYLVDFYLPT